MPGDSTAAFQFFSGYAPAGDQPRKAFGVAKLTDGLLSVAKHQVLLGVTGSGKTFAIANVIRNVTKPTNGFLRTLKGEAVR